MINNEFNVFLAFILIGIIIGLFFDFFRVLRKVYQTKNFVTIVEDILFWILSGTIMLTGIFILNGGKIRLYLFIGIIIGLFFYISSISKYFIMVGTKILNLFNFAVLRPITKTIKKILFFLQKIVYNIIVLLKNIYFDLFKHNNMKKRRNN